MEHTPSRSPAQARLALVASVAPFVLFAAAWLLLVPSMGRMQYVDYYGIVAQLDEHEHFTARPLRWLLVKSNEHTAVVPALVYAANATLFAGDNRVLSGLSLLWLLAICLLLRRLLPAGLRDGPRGVLWSVVLGGLVFTPAAAHSVVFGFSGTIWFVANLLAVLAVRRLVAAAGGQGRGAFVSAAAAGLVGAITYSTNLSLWPALLLAAVLLGLAARRLVVLAGGGALAVAFATVTYARPAHHTPPTVADPAAVGEFFAVYLGAPLAQGQVAAGVVGIAGLLATAALVVALLVRRRRDDLPALAPWLALQLYAVGNALGTAIARVGMGGARSSRYASVAMFFWIGLVAAAATLATRSGARRRNAMAGLALVGGLALAGATWVRGGSTLRTYLERAARQPLAELAVVHEVDDRPALAAVTPAPQEIAALRPFLTALHHVPFDRPPFATHGERVQVDSTATAPARLDPRTFTVTPVGGGVLRIELTAPPVSTAESELVLVDGDGTVRGALVDVTPPRIVGWLGGDATRRWAGYLAPSGAATQFLLCPAHPAGAARRPLVVLSLAGRLPARRADPALAQPRPTDS